MGKGREIFAVRHFLCAIMSIIRSFYADIKPERTTTTMSICARDYSN